MAAAAPQLPFYYYHMPGMTGVTLPAADFLSGASTQIPNLAGVKFTHENLMDFGRSTESPSRVMSGATLVAHHAAIRRQK